ncbi:putative replication protein [uncultured virus]|uniref:Putative replication protein n=1 Tax=uncultured virus TaxID=340016 RepID=A0A1I9XGE3_9VIRU|nr:putative replication protein [uncultured virus]
MYVCRNSSLITSTASRGIGGYGRRSVPLLRGNGRRSGLRMGSRSASSKALQALERRGASMLPTPVSMSSPRLTRAEGHLGSTDTLASLLSYWTTSPVRSRSPSCSD